jgi:phosphoglycolate phosphatase-like HAD superfamily hydrolase
MGLQMILERLRLSDAWYFGDTVDDMLAANRAKIRGIGVFPPSIQSKQLRNKLLKAGAQEIIDTIQDIREIVP